MGSNNIRYILLNKMIIIIIIVAIVSTHMGTTTNKKKITAALKYIYIHKYIQLTRIKKNKHK